MDHARPLLLRWMSLRARFGFSEWLSNVYLMEDLKGLLLLADWSDDDELARLVVDAARRAVRGAGRRTCRRARSAPPTAART